MAKTASKQIDKTTHKPKDRAAFVLMSPQTGDVLVAATFPTFDPNALTPELYRSLIVGPDAEQEHPLINRAVDGLYPPGSTMKVATAAFALDAQPNAMQFPRCLQPRLGRNQVAGGRQNVCGARHPR